MARKMKKDTAIIIVGAGVFGLTTAYELASEGYHNIRVLHRHVAPLRKESTSFERYAKCPKVPDGSSVDISRVMHFDYADPDYLRLAYDAYKKESQHPKYSHTLVPSAFLLTSNTRSPGTYIDRTTAALAKASLPWRKLDTAEAARRLYQVLSGPLAGPNFECYQNEQAGWVDAENAVT
ncbi:hypothetical protein AYO20_08010 [Fonsecaea nubica]|uniref:FAD dependent oxidoreductase domain-containing protein n=1 Tax=Fonsecaea nubica TaxID=856822 RepID=A0A178CSC8_9EURO|nr:hypothetical protein AYO20_08010 [Fonsecaea nubica]OAL32072.1 hypothetical protein AYO20_08010 [Fonsecaea nubica]